MTDTSEHAEWVPALAATTHTAITTNSTKEN